MMIPMDIIESTEIAKVDTTTTGGPVAEEKETQDLYGGAEKAEAQDLRGGAERAETQDLQGGAEYFDLSPEKQKTAHPLEALARKLSEGPPARLSAQGRTGALRNTAPARTSSNRRDAVAHVGGGVQEDVQFLTACGTIATPMGADCRGDTHAAHRAPAIKVLQEKPRASLALVIIE